MVKAYIAVSLLLLSLALYGRQIACQTQLTPTPIPTPTPLCASQFALVNHACSFLPYTLISPPAPSGPPSDPPSLPNVLEPEDHSEWQQLYHHEHHHHHHHHHHHNHRPSRHTPTPVEMDCCRWLREVDTLCVCDLLVHLPAFLAKPAHDYTVVVAEACDITYSCSGRVRP
ncbi:hypothetical protein SAY86_014660 [Trapa natans]|uniref:Bifunctional inhibitor/plant lipid transfer protein/seed storage helical domain-containing protein n=1 Tax=Trapa natans TaxID=22666 RepID=A0AAN7QGG7_TRANT|nr:hypothetical protein SAY86_014660 [Trapa natans]